jgi:hypothetical protein
MNKTDLEESVLSSLEQLKQTSVEEEQQEIIVEKLPVIKSSDYDFESKRFFFDEIYFQNSKIIKM